MRIILMLVVCLSLKGADHRYVYAMGTERKAYVSGATDAMLDEVRAYIADPRAKVMIAYMLTAWIPSDKVFALHTKKLEELTGVQTQTKALIQGFEKLGAGAAVQDSKINPEEQAQKVLALAREPYEQNIAAMVQAGVLERVDVGVQWPKVAGLPYPPMFSVMKAAIGRDAAGNFAFRDPHYKEVAGAASADGGAQEAQ